MRLIDYKDEEWFKEIVTFYETTFKENLLEILPVKISNENRLSPNQVPRKMTIILYRDGYITFEELCRLFQMIESDDKENEYIYISILNTKYQLYYETRLE